MSGRLYILRSAALIAGWAWVLALAPGGAGAADGTPPPAAIPAASSAVLRRVLDLSLGDGGSYYLSARQLRVMPGGPFRLNGSGEPLETVEIRAPQEVREPPHGAPIPFGLVGIVWGVQHPTQAWRLFLPVVD